LSAPLIWVIFPLAVSLLLYVFRRWRRPVLITGISIALILAVLAWQVPYGRPVHLGAWPVVPDQLIDESMNILGRQIVLTNDLRSLLILIYIFLALWLGGAESAYADSLFVPIGMATAALLTAALGVRPFLYAALLIELVILITVPLLNPPGRPAGPGVLRFITFQTLGMPFILFSGLVLSAEPLGFMEQTLAIRAAWIAGLGLIFFASIFPFHTWIPMVSSEAHPYSAGFVLLTLPTVISLFIMVYLLELISPIAQPATWLSLRFLGMLMLVLGGVWSAFQINMGRMMGFIVTAEIGIFLLSISLAIDGNLNRAVSITLVQIIPRAISLAILALSFSIIRHHFQTLTIDRLRGVMRQLPIATISILLAFLSLAGLPLLAGFPARLLLWSALARQSLPLAVATIVTGLGIIAGSVRLLVVFIDKGDGAEGWRISENRTQSLLLVAGWVILFAIGLFPQYFLEPLSGLTIIQLP